MLNHARSRCEKIFFPSTIYEHATSAIAIYRMSIFSFSHANFRSKYDEGIAKIDRTFKWDFDRTRISNESGGDFSSRDSPLIRAHDQELGLARSLFSNFIRDPSVSFAIATLSRDARCNHSTAMIQYQNKLRKFRRASPTTKEASAAIAKRQRSPRGGTRSRTNYVS